MQRLELITQLLETDTKAVHRNLYKNNPTIVDLKLAEDLKDTYYNSWTTEPRKTRNAALALAVLADIIPEIEVKALAYWVMAISNLTEGKTQSAIKNIDKASEIFTSLGKEYQAAQTQVSKLYALALLGNYDEAVECGKEALKIFEKNKDELSAGKIENNIGNIYWRREIHDKAEKQFLSARRRFIKINDLTQLTMIEHCLATSFAYQNKFHEAERFYKKALARSVQAEMVVTQAEIEASMGNLSLFRGKFDKALKFLELSRQKYEKLQMPHQSAVAELEMADVYLELNLINEAFEIYERVTETLEQLKMQGEEARARTNFARAAIHLGKNELAFNQLKKSANLYRAEKNSAGKAFVKLIETQLAFSIQDYQRALKLSEKTAEMLNKSGNLRYALLSKWLQGEILIKLKRYPESEIFFKQTLRDAIKQENLFFAQSSQTSLGKLSLKKNEVAAAESHFKKAINLIENLRDPLPAEDFRMAFFADKLLSYQSLAQIYLKQDKIKEAFQLVERSRSRALAESLSETEQKQNIRSADSAKLFKELTDLREELNWFYSRSNRASVEESNSLLPETQKRERKINELMRQIKNIDGKGLYQEESFDLKELQKSLGSERVLLEFVSFEDKISVFVITGKKIEFIENLATEEEISELLEGLHFQFETMRYGEANLGPFAADLKRRTDFYLKKLYQKLFSKLENSIGNLHLVIVPFGRLHYLPFHALFDGESYIIEKREVSYAPSATVLQHCLQKEKGSLKNALLVGFADEKIPFVVEEVKKLKKVMTENLTLIDQKATFNNFKRNAENFDVIHLACHGQFRKDNPMFSSLKLADGFLTVRDIGELKLNAGLVVLSACETGLNKILAGEELLGLTRGFLSAGALSLILTLWTVNDQAAQELIIRLYENLQKGETISESLRNAQCNLIKQNSHPYLWSPFFLTGRW